MPFSSNFEHLLNDVFQGNEETLTALIAFLNKPLLPTQIDLLNTKVDYALNEDPENLAALFLKGYIAQYGLGCKRNYLEALSLYRTASERGHLTATFRLGCLYKTGRGVAVDQAEALRLFQKAGQRDCPEALYAAGCMFIYGEEGVPVDVAQGIVYIEKAGSLGNVNAQIARGKLFHDGVGGPPDYLAAAKLYRQALEASNEQAKTYLTELKQTVQPYLKSTKKIDELSYSISVGLQDKLWKKDPDNYLVFLVKDELLSLEQKTSILASMLKTFPDLTKKYQSVSNGELSSFFAKAERLAHTKQQNSAHKKYFKQIKQILLSVAPKVGMAFMRIDSQLKPKRWQHKHLHFWPDRQPKDTTTINNFLDTIEADELGKKEFVSIEENQALVQKYTSLIRVILEKSVKDPYAQAASNILSQILQEINYFEDIIKSDQTTHTIVYR